jgi:fused signal recognition particle receptor
MQIFRKGLERTRKSLVGGLTNLLGSAEITEETFDDLEALLIQSDIGVPTTFELMDRIRSRRNWEGLTKVHELEKALKEEMRALLGDRPPRFNIHGRPHSVILVIGVNGSGKTTTIAKLAYKFRQANRKPLLAAGDTFRAAAIEQLQTWGERAGAPVVAGTQGGDPGAVVYDALQAAKARGHDLVLIDTAGRLHTKYNLMEELRKIKGVMKKQIDDAPHETWLVLDGTTGQNALEQARKFKEDIGVTGIIVTKLDGTPKGGMIFAIFQELDLPVRFIGLGEGMDDLVMFDPDEFVDAIFDD